MKKLNLILGILSMLVLNVTAASTTNQVSVTTNLVFSLKREHDWHPQDEFKHDDLIFWAVEMEATNITKFRMFTFDQAFDFHLYEQSGQEVSKTSKGRKWSQPLVSPQSMRQAANLHGNNTGGSYVLFRPSDAFEISSNGVYDMEIRVRIWAPVTNNTPDYEIWTHFGKLKDSNVHYGVVVSPPLRVKIIKQDTNSTNVHFK